MREFGVRRYGDKQYQHCMAETAADAANWYAHSQAGLARKNFQALVKDVSRPVVDESGFGDNPAVVRVRPSPLSEGANKATDLKRSSATR